MDLNVEISSMPKGVVKGVHRATFSEKGLMLEKKGTERFLIPVGTQAVFDGKQSVTVTRDGVQLSLRMLGLRVENARLAQDTAAYLAGSGPQPKVDDYVVPGFLFALALLPLAIPILTLGGMIPGAIGGGLAFASMSLAKNRDLSIPIRAALILAMSLVGVGVTVALLLALAGTQPG